MNADLQAGVVVGRRRYTHTQPSPPREVYDVRLAIDIPIIVVGSATGLVRTYLANHHVDQRCPCSPDEINSFDRRALGNHSDTAGRVSDITVGLALAVPPIVDLFVIVPTPRLALAVIMGSARAVLLASQRVRPRVLLETGFVFRYPTLDTALADLVADGAGRRSGHGSSTESPRSAPRHGRPWDRRSSSACSSLQVRKRPASGRR